MDQGEADQTSHWQAERQRLQQEVSNLLDLAAAGVGMDTAALKIRERQLQIAKLEVQPRQPRAAEHHSSGPR